MRISERIVARRKRAQMVERTVERFKLAGGWDGKFVGKDARLVWSRHIFKLEELPQKGKKKLRAAEIQNPSTYGAFDYYIPGNILMFAKLSPSDDYDKIKKKIDEAFAEAHERTLKNGHEKEKAQLQDGKSWISQVKWYEDQVFYLNVIPEGVDDFTAEGKDFTVKVKWTEFSAYSPDSDFQQADPYYTKYVSKSPTAARKFYVVLKQDPNALKSVVWSNFGEWLTKQKIPYDTRFSQWT